MKLNISDELNDSKIKEILDLYPNLSSNNEIDYLELIDHLIKDIKSKNKNFKKKVILNYSDKTSNLSKTSTNLRPFSAKLPSVSKLISEGKNLKVDLNEVKSEIRTIKTALNRIKEKVFFF